MSDIIDDVLRAETDAQEIVEEAKRSASRRRTAADTEAAKIVADAREEASRLLKEELARAKAQAQATTDDAVGGAEQSGRKYMDENSRVMRELVQSVVSYITTPEYGR